MRYYVFLHVFAFSMHTIYSVGYEHKMPFVAACQSFNSPVFQGGHVLTPLPAATPLKPGSAVSDTNSLLVQS